MKVTTTNKLIWIFISTCLSCTSVIILFKISEARMHQENPFIRRYPQGTSKDKDKDLHYNSYYFAGTSGDSIYMGNTTAPLLVTLADTAIENISKYSIRLDKSYRPAETQLRVGPSHFYLIDGTQPGIYMGLKSKWEATLRWRGQQPFSQPQLTSAYSLACRTIDPKSGESELALLRFDNDLFDIKDNVLEKQVDGIFDSDGRLHYDPLTARLVYTYLYRNQFISTDNSLNLIRRGKTIDTITHANIKVSYVEDHAEKKFAAPPLEVNRTSAVWGNLLFVNSALVGKFEEKQVWKQASIIDAYNLDNGNYIASFYIYNIDNKRLRSFIVTRQYLYALVGTHIVRYRLAEVITSHYTKK